MNLIQRVKNFFPSRLNLNKSNLFVPITSWWPGFGVNRKTDIQIIEEGFISNSDFYSVVNKICQTSRTLLFRVDRINNRNNIVSNEGWEYDLLTNPNQEDNTKDLIEKTCINLLSTGDGFIWAVGSSGGARPLELLPLRSVSLTLTLGVNKELIQITYNDGNGNVIPIPPDELIHIKFYDPSSYGEANNRGLSPGNPGYNIIDASNELATADAWTLKNKGAAGFISNKGTHKLTKEEAQAVQDSLSSDIGGASNKNKVTVTSADLKYQQVSMSPTDLKIQESYVVKLRQICNVLNADSSLFNDPANKRFNNQKEANKFLYQSAVLPLVERIISAIQKHLKRSGSKSSIEVITDHIEALQGDKLQEVQKNKEKSEGVQETLIKYNTNEISLEQATYVLSKIWDIPEEEIRVIL